MQRVRRLFIDMLFIDRLLIDTHEHASLSIPAQQLRSKDDVTVRVDQIVTAPVLR
jgi:hypothetical protein